nr:hypothetical protein [Tanacetum cinerariifolium]
MASEGVQNMVARRVTDDYIIFNEETSPSRLDRLNEVIDDALEEIEKLETIWKAVYGCVFCCLELGEEVDGVAKCLEHMKVIVARDVVTLGDLETVWAHCQVGKSLKAGFMADMKCKSSRSLVVDFQYMGVCFVVWNLAKLAEIAESPRLGDKIKYVFERSRGEDKYLSRMIVDLYVAYRVSLGKKRRLIAELEAA